MTSDATVHVVDDDATLRRSLMFLIESMGWRVQTFESAESFLQASPQPPGCLVLDVRMPSMSGLELQRTMQQRGIELPIIFITGHADVSLAVQAMKQGAVEFLEKPFRDQALLDAIAQAMRRSVATLGARRAHHAVHAQFEQLTAREKEVALRVARGQPNRVIALALGISAKTVQVHRQHVLEKMQAHSAAELAALLLPVLAAAQRPD
jgi:two-component system, LuxR family, response regulator FixJ